MRVWITVLAGGCGLLGPETPTGTSGETGALDTGACDPTEQVVSYYCQQDLCNLCTDDCPTRDESTAGLAPCGATTDPYACCVDTCTDPALGDLDEVYCPDAYGGATWWFEPTTGDLVGYAWSTDYNGWCDGGAFGQLFGPDLTGCQ